MNKLFFASALGAALVSLAPVAIALTQPDGTVIPVPQTDQSDLQTILNQQGETGIMVQRDAADTPETFMPDCSLTFKMISRGRAGFQDAFGWYNVVPGQAPADTDLYPFIPCTAQPGQTFTLNVRTDPNYTGGAIGFFLRTPEGSCDSCATLTNTGYTYYTEREYNPDNTGANSYIHLLIYDSSVTPHAFYFAWEDLFAGGDNNFSDFVAEVSGIVCTGAGGSCDTGRPGICAAGTMQCHDGTLTCTEISQPTMETCDGLDDDCNGMVDDGMNLCPAGQVCDRGQCVPTCVEGACFSGEVCSLRGTCVEADCATVTCPAGQVCYGGVCMGACDGVMCPSGQTCREGRCVDPCAGVTCDTNQVCVSGVCTQLCGCTGCSAGQTCQPDGSCIVTACMGITCPTGEVCNAGACQDACTGAICPRGQVCVTGQCVESPDAGVTVQNDGGASDTGTVVPDATSRGYPDAADGANGDARMDGTASNADSGGGLQAHGTGSACGCRAAGSGRLAEGWASVMFIVLFVRRKRQRSV